MEHPDGHHLMDIIWPHLRGKKGEAAEQGPQRDAREKCGQKLVHDQAFGTKPEACHNSCVGPVPPSFTHYPKGKFVCCCGPQWLQEYNGAGKLDSLNRPSQCAAPDARVKELQELLARAVNASGSKAGGSGSALWSPALESASENLGMSDAHSDLLRLLLTWFQSQLPEQDFVALMEVLAPSADGVDLFRNDAMGVTSLMRDYATHLDVMFSAIADATNFPLFTAWRLVFLMTLPEWGGQCEWSDQASDMTFFEVEMLKRGHSCNAPDQLLTAGFEFPKSIEGTVRKIGSLRLCAELCYAEPTCHFFGFGWNASMWSLDAKDHYKNVNVCWQESTTSDNCVEGFQPAFGFSFYALRRESSYTTVNRTMWNHLWKYHSDYDVLKWTEVEYREAQVKAGYPHINPEEERRKKIAQDKEYIAEKRKEIEQKTYAEGGVDFRSHNFPPAILQKNSNVDGKAATTCVITGASCTLNKGTTFGFGAMKLSIHDDAKGNGIQAAMLPCSQPGHEHPAHMCTCFYDTVYRRGKCAAEGFVGDVAASSNAHNESSVLRVIAEFGAHAISLQSPNLRHGELDPSIQKHGYKKNEYVMRGLDMAKVITMNACGVDACCSPCKVGHFRSGQSASFHCVACPSGFFAEAEGQAQCKECDSGRFQPAAGMTACAACAAGWVAGVGAKACRRCQRGEVTDAAKHECVRCKAHLFKLNATECSICPTTEGVQCVDGVLEPQDGFWSPDAAAVASGRAPARFAESTTTFPCLAGIKSCVANRGTTAGARAANASDGDGGGEVVVVPSTAFRCTEGHRG